MAASNCSLSAERTSGLNLACLLAGKAWNNNSINTDCVIVGHKAVASTGVWLTVLGEEMTLLEAAASSATRALHTLRRKLCRRACGRPTSQH